MIDTAERFQPELYRSYVGMLARVCLRNLGHLQPKLDPSDIVQEAMLQAHVALRQFHGSTKREFAAWLREILENKMLDAVRHYGRKKRDARLEQTLCETLHEASSRFEKRFEKVIAADRTSPSQHMARDERARFLAESLAVLPEDQRMALELHHLQGYSWQETAWFMNRTAAGVAGLLRRGLIAMREDLQDREGDLR